MTPRALHFSMMKATSLSVSVGNLLTATTQGSLYTFLMLLTWRSRLGTPFSSAARSS